MGSGAGIGAHPSLGKARTALRSGACGLEGLTGTESPAAEGMYRMGPGWVGLDTAEEGWRSSLRGGSAKDGGRGQQASKPVPEMLFHIEGWSLPYFYHPGPSTGHQPGLSTVTKDTRNIRLFISQVRKQRQRGKLNPASP